MDANVVNGDHLEKVMSEKNIKYTRSGRRVVPPLAFWVGERIVTPSREDIPQIYHGLENVDSKGAFYLLPHNAYERHKRQSLSSVCETKSNYKKKRNVTPLAKHPKRRTGSGAKNTKSSHRTSEDESPMTKYLHRRRKTSMQDGVLNSLGEGSISDEEAKDTHKKRNLHIGDTLKRRRSTFNVLSLACKKSEDEMHIPKKPGVQALLKLEESLNQDSNDSSDSICTPSGSVHGISPMSNGEIPPFRSKFSLKEFHTSRKAAEQYMFRREKLIKKKTLAKIKNQDNSVHQYFSIKKHSSEGCKYNIPNEETEIENSSIDSADVDASHNENSESDVEIYCNY